MVNVATGFAQMLCIERMWEKKEGVVFNTMVDGWWEEVK
jgi:hypothetical protein